MGKQRPAKPLLEPVSEDGNSSFARALGSVDYLTRERGLQALTVFLTRRQQLEPLDWRKLWKGLFYCFWHADLSHVQEELATRLAGVLSSLSEEMAAGYFGTFLETMQREWFGIDRLRLDKFLMLVRKFVREMFVHLQAASWEEAEVARYCAFLRGVLAASDEQTSAGLAFQLADVAVPELLAALQQSKAQAPEAALRQLLGVFVATMATATRKSLPGRVRDGVFAPLLQELRAPSEGAPLKALQPASLAEAVFAAGADPAVRVANRVALYELSAELEGVPSGRKRARAAADGSPEPQRKHPRDAEGQPSAAAGSSGRAAAPEAAAAAEAPAAAEGSAPAAATAAAEPAAASGGTATPARKKGKRRQTGGLEAAAVAALAEATDAMGKAAAAAAAAPATAPAGSKQARSRLQEAAAVSTPVERAGKPAQNGVASAVPGRLRSAAQAAGAGTPGSSEKHVKWALKRNLYFAKGGTVPEPSVRTPDSCRPKGSALKKQSKFPSPRGSPRFGTGGAGKGKARRKRSSLQPAALADLLESA